MKRWFAMAAFLGMMVVFITGDAYSQGSKTSASKSTEISDYGMPSKYSKKQKGFWLWYDKKTGWNFRTTGGGKSHRFEGRIEPVGGTFAFETIQGLNGESRGKKGDNCQFTKTVMVFTFNTGKADDGVRFNVTPMTKEIKFAIKIDGQAAPTYIRIGNDGSNPAEAVFKVPARPEATSGGSPNGKLKETDPTFDNDPKKNPRKK